MMILKKSAIVIGLGLAFGIGGASIFFAAKKTNNPHPQGSLQVFSAKAPDLATWTDQAGFTFEYPKDLLVNKHDEDTDNYAHIELTSPGHPGSIIVWAKDSQWDDLDTWVKQDKRFAQATIADTTIGGQPGKKVLIAGPPQERIVGTIADNILFTVEGNLIDTQYWSTVAETIASSFTFTTNTATASSTDSTTAGDDTGSSDGPVDEEEVIQ